MQGNDSDQIRDGRLGAKGIFWIGTSVDTVSQIKQQKQQHDIILTYKKEFRCQFYII
jgi:hypothetical protein